MFRIIFNQKNKVFMDIKDNENIIIYNDGSVYDNMYEFNIGNSIIENLEKFNIIFGLQYNLQITDDSKNQLYNLLLREENHYLNFENIFNKNNLEFFKQKCLTLYLKKESIVTILKHIDKEIEYSDKKNIFFIDLSFDENIKELIEIIKKLNKKNSIFIFSIHKVIKELDDICIHKLTLGCLKSFGNYRNNAYIYDKEIRSYNIIEDEKLKKMSKAKDLNELLMDLEEFKLKNILLEF